MEPRTKGKRMSWKIPIPEKFNMDEVEKTLDSFLKA